MKDLVIILPSPLTERDFKRYGISKLNEKFNLKILDFTLWDCPDYVSRTATDIHYFKEYYSITSKNEFFKIKFNNEKLFLIDLSSPYDPKFKWIRKYFKERKCITIHYYVNIMPREKIILSKHISDLFKSPIKMIGKIKNYLIRMHYNNFTIPDICIFGGIAGFDQSKAKYKLKAHSMDYDIYSNIKKVPSTYKKPYVVFLDEDFVYHHWLCQQVYLKSLVIQGYLFY